MFKFTFLGRTLLVYFATVTSQTLLVYFAAIAFVLMIHTFV